MSLNEPNLSAPEKREGTQLSSESLRMGRMRERNLSHSIVASTIYATAPLHACLKAAFPTQ
jgi:hypothetical protein